ALDALVREGVADPVDLMLVASSRVEDLADVGTLAEASMNPDVEAVLRAWSRFMRAAIQEDEGSIPPSVAMPPASTAELSSTPTPPGIEAIFEISAALGDDGSGCVEALREVLISIARTLKQLAGLSSRRAIDEAANTFDALAGAAHAWAQMEDGAVLRVLG